MKRTFLCLFKNEAGIFEEGLDLIVFAIVSALSFPVAIRIINLDFKNEPIFALINLVLYILLIIVIYQIFLKITEHSPLFETVTMSLLTIIIINSLRYEYLLGKSTGENKEFKLNINEFKHIVQQSFVHLREDIKEIKKKIK